MSPDRITHELKFFFFFFTEQKPKRTTKFRGRGGEVTQIPENNF